MKEHKRWIVNISIMVIPLLILMLPFVKPFWDLIFPILAALIFLVIYLAKKLELKDAIVYPLVQYPFLVLLNYLFSTISPGPGFIVIFPLILGANMLIGLIIFYKDGNPSWFKKILVLPITLFITVAIYSEHNGRSAIWILIERVTGQ